MELDRFRKFSRLGEWCALVFAAVVAWSCSSEVGQIHQTGEEKDGLASCNGIEYQRISEWGNGFEAEVKISCPIGWVLEFDFPYNISSIWNATIDSHAGWHYVIRGPGWDISSFGFIGSGGDGSIAPSNIIINGNHSVPQSQPAPGEGGQVPGLGSPDGGSEGSTPSDYTPALPKTSPIQGVQVFDLTVDLSSRTAQAREVYFLAVVLQGLVNRTSSDKIYFTHSPTEWGWYVPASDPLNWPADQAWLDDGLIPVPHTVPMLDKAKTYPVLSYLLQNYGSYIKGQVLIPNMDGKVVDGALAYALTACGILDAVPVSTATAALLRIAGLKPPILDDARGFTTSVAAFDAAYRRYFVTQTTRAFVGTFSAHAFGCTLQFPNMADYLVAHRAFVYALDASQAEDAKRLSTLYTPANYPYGTPTIGIPFSEKKDISAVEDLGYPVDIAGTPDLSVTSAFPSEPQQVPGRIRSAPASVDPKGVYVAFYVTDGDSWNFSTRKHYYHWTRSASAGGTPIGWSTNVQMVDVFPTLVQHLATANFGGAYEMVANSWHVGRAGGNGFQPFISRYKRYVSQTGGGNVFRSVNLVPFGESTTEAQLNTVADQVGFGLFIAGYAGGDGQVVNFSSYGTRPVIKTGLSGPTQNGTSVDTIYRAITANAGKSPSFVIVTAGDGGSLDSPTAIEQAVARAKAKTTGRNFYFLAPSDVAAIYRLAHKLPALP